MTVATNSPTLELPKNAKDVAEAGRDQILVVGGIGVGKTTLFRTLPGKKFIYAFDPNCVRALRGSDIEYMEFCPDYTDIDLSAKTLRAPEKQVKIDKSSRKDVEPMTYVNWERDFEGRLEDGFFRDHTWIGFDSITTFSEIIMDRIQYLNGRLGKHPEQADWTAQMNVTRNVFRVANSVCNVYAAAHTETFKDEFTGRVHGKIMVTGRNRIRIPLMFAHIFALHVEPGKGTSPASYVLKTTADRENPVVRTALNLNAVEDITLDMRRPLEGQGILATHFKEVRPNLG
jgi:hypothetical protein